MTTKKYEFVEGDTITIAPGRTAKRIRALVAIAATTFTPAVAAGDLGGYIESEDNLTPQVSGNAWVSKRNHVVWFTHVGSGNGTLTVFNAKDNVVYAIRGCFTGTADEFLAKSAKVHDGRVQHEYKLLVEVARSRIANA